MERDFALKEMKAMANQCQTVAEEFELLAKRCESLKEQLTKVCHCKYWFTKAHYVSLKPKEMLLFKLVKGLLRLMNYYTKNWS